MKTYTFDVKLFTNIEVKAESVSAARRQLRELLHGATANFGSFPNGEPILSDVVLDTEDGAELVEVDGEAV